MKKASERRVVRKPELIQRVGLADTSIWRLEKAGRFPKRIRLGGQSVGWFSDEIDQWLEEKAASRA